MTINYPTSLDTLTNPTATDEMDDAGVLHDVEHADANDGIEALEAKVGVDDSAVTTSLDWQVHKELGPWFQDDVAASQTDVALNLVGGGRTEWVAVRAHSLTGVVVRSNEARSAGTLTVEVLINGAASGLTAVLDGTNTTVKATTQARDLDAIAAGDRIGVKVTTDGSWSPTTADITVVVEVA